MLKRAVLCLFSVSLVCAFDAQLPLWSGQDTYRISDEDIISWNLNNSPNPNATDNLVFETVHSLLQHWPNTRMRNGHNIVPGSIPKGTLLYHGTNRHELPPGPEWVATDPEHSYHFCRDPPGGHRHSEQGCWHLTLMTTRPLKIVYFDGSSAAKTSYGSLDTQDLLAWGEVRPGSGDDWQRMEDLCKWGKDFDVDGFVRMEMDFEAMLCDFTSGVSVVSFSNLVESGHHSSNFLSPSFEVFNAGSWHNHFPGETRVHLDLAGLISFYDTRLATSLIAIRASQERWDHRVQNISTEDLSAVKSRLEAILTRPPGLSSGIDWRTLIQVVVDRYAQRLELTRYLLNSSTTDLVEILDLANKTQTQLRIMLTPYLVLSAAPSNPPDRDDLNWTIPIFKLCATTHTYWMDPESDSMTDSEKLLLQAVRGTTREICRVVTKMWAAGVHAGLDRIFNTKESESLYISEIMYLWSAWKEDLSRLMTWLDWSVWVKCDPGCGFEEICYLPTWPIGFPHLPRGPRPPHLGSSGTDGPRPERLPGSDSRNMVTENLMDERNIIKPFEDEWMRPQPRCIRRVDPYDF